MKPVYLISALFLFSLRAQAPTPVPLARGNAPGEPHHHLKIENAYVRAYYVEVPPHGETQLHQHDHDYIFVALGDSDVTNAILGKPEVHLQLKDGEVRFTRGGFAHVARNNSNAPFRNVTIAFLQPQQNPHNVCREVIPGPVQDCSRPPINRFPNSPLLNVPLFSTDKIFIVDVSIPAKDNHLRSVESPGSSLLVALTDPGLKFSISGQPSTQFGLGGVAWLSKGQKFSVSAPRGVPLRYLWISFQEEHGGSSK